MSAIEKITLKNKLVDFKTFEDLIQKIIAKKRTNDKLQSVELQNNNSLEILNKTKN